MAAMHTTFQRLNSVTAFGTSTILALLAIIAFFSFPVSYKPRGTVEVHSLKVVSGRAQYHFDRREQEYLTTEFDIDADFSGLFNWNTKQVFVSLAAEYISSKHPQNQVVVWDHIIRSKADAHVQAKGNLNKYGFREVSKSFNNITQAEFILKWNTMPYVGALAYGDQARTEPVPVPVRAIKEEGTQKSKKRLPY
ncbi:signal peptidase 22 kDa subunit [Tilletiaria anomala UBC 951]|uniref:Signal peptidase subunit 3 n=1 Tax=Tilletiaria anomala (strain ATCC 24038 / CBS 436.72 / UBC 951) TaxID=1037660 RepID=A0A066VRL1_TILAU|nr:signal peptidase 22 kDa subunit [Tilletiaria anomala UBC 951]KDN41429.1 signal peptidase 22 kDa subunit [Tilletiaria anomala UBC 951]